MRGWLRYALWSVGAIVLLYIVHEAEQSLQKYAADTFQMKVPFVLHLLMWVVMGAYTGLLFTRKLRWNPHRGLLIGTTLPAVIVLAYTICAVLFGFSLPSYELLDALTGQFFPVLCGLSIVLGCFGGNENARSVSEK